MTEQPTDTPPPVTAAALLADLQRQRLALWRHIAATDQWQRLQQLDGAIQALELLAQQPPATP